MRTILRYVALLLCVTPAAAQPSRGALHPGVIAFTDVAVIPMTGDSVLRGRTVVIRDGRIVSITPAGRAAVPAGARRIDGRGKYLIPGLADMHTHLFADGTLPQSVAPAELGVMVANGVTSARLMIGTPQHLELRRQVSAGTVLGPQLWVASPQFTGSPGENAFVVTTPDSARRAVRTARESGYEFIKLTTDISLPVYDAIVDEARTAGIPVVGHVDGAVGLGRALAAGQQIEHLDSYFEAALADSAPRIPLSNYAVFPLANWAALDHVDDRRVDSLARATVAAGVWSTPTLMLFNTAFALGETDEQLHARPDWAMLPAAWRDGYLRARGRYWSETARAARTEARRARYVAVRNRLVRGIAREGGRLMAGSDTPEWFHLYGFALHRELEAMVGAGLTPYEALRTATVNPAEYLGAAGAWGTIRPGLRADLVLLAANPLEDVRNTRRIEGVMAGGRWLDAAELQRLIDAGTAALTRPR